jgi:predicted alpha/beta-hydrolase family hydrolase
MPRHGLILTHGAGSNRDAPLLQALDLEFTAAGFLVARVNLAFRETRPHGSPFPAGAAADREGLARNIQEMRAQVDGRVFVGGHSYGGRQATMLAAENPGLADALLLLSYPLHPPKQPDKLRTAHLPNLQTPALFVHGTRDPFGSIEEMKKALALIPGVNRLMEVEGAGHDLKEASPARIASAFMAIADAV